MKQFSFLKEVEEESKYTKKVEAPIYTPRGECPNLIELVNTQKADNLILEIQSSNISEDIKNFLTLAAYRHIIFNYEKIADYYAHAPKEVQELMERSALVIIDFEKAIELGYVKLTDEITNNYLIEYPSNET